MDGSSTKPSPRQMHTRVDPVPSVGGLLSPQQRITLDEASRAAAGIPPNAVSVMFAYPLPSLAAHLDEIVYTDKQVEPWVFFCLLGGYCYFDKLNRAVQVNAFVLSPSPPLLMHLIGPYMANAEATDWLQAKGRIGCQDARSRKAQHTARGMNTTTHTTAKCAASAACIRVPVCVSRRPRVPSRWRASCRCAHVLVVVAVT